MSIVKTNVLLTEPKWLRYLLIGITLLCLSVLLLLPLLSVFSYALAKGWELYMAALLDDEALAAMRLSLLITLIVVPINVVLGVAMAWLLTHFTFRGKQLWTTLLDLPFAVSPVVAGLMFVLLFGSNSWLGSWMEAHGVQVIFAIPGMILATLFVTFPFVARELIPLMQAQGSSEEQAALILGASGWQMFWRVTLPNLKWALVYGIILTNARAMGEFGAVSMVSGHIRGETNTMPLLVEMMYNEYNMVGAFAVSSLLALLALCTLLLQKYLDWRQTRMYRDAQRARIAVTN
ncbi:sulfate ABC transporter permease subunit CysW [Snodgrassella sp. CS2]|uniref:sulfate ABC transporter permease subunit CysW n=1 Tax=Snodgrassella sp. CS2 TaxID=3418953 RepID=UPI003CFE74D5